MELTLWKDTMYNAMAFHTSSFVNNYIETTLLLLMSNCTNN